MTESKNATALISLMRNYADYNLWANTKYVSWLKAKAFDLLEKEILSSFSSIRSTLIHIWETERFWLSVLQQVPFPKPLRDGYDGTLDDIFEGILSHSYDFAAYVQTLSETELLENVMLITPWAEGTQPRFEFIQHCMNHSTYHRGQVVTIGRNLGITDAPMTDYNYYLTMLKG
jgi:uncharacterized damage-inducible protein DinB